MRAYTLSPAKWFTAHVLPTCDACWLHCYLVGSNAMYTYDVLSILLVLVPSDDKTTDVLQRDIN